MKNTKLYNIFFPIWILIFFPPVSLAAIAINSVVDSIVILMCLRVWQKDIINEMTILKAYRKVILKVIVFGFLADFVGAILLGIVVFGEDALGGNSSVISDLAVDPFSSIVAFLLMTVFIMISAIIIYKLNNKYSMPLIIDDIKVKGKIALTVAIITAPWTFYLPARLFYNW